MAKLNPAQFTKVGLRAAADLFAHKKSNKISHVSISTTDYTGKDVSELNKLSNEVLVVVPSEMKQNGNVYTITSVFDSSRISNDSTIWSIGVYVLDNNGVEALLAVITSSNPDFIPAGGGENQSSIVYDINIAVNNSGVTFDLTIDDNAMAQMKDIRETRIYAESLVAALDLSVVHLTGDEQIGGVKKFLKTIIGSVSGNAGSANIANALNIRTTTATTLDTDEFTSRPGFYYIPEAQAVTSAPFAKGAYFIESALTTVDENMVVIQRAYSTDSMQESVFRTYQSGEWTEWRSYI